MNYFAITQETAGIILGNDTCRTALANTLGQLITRESLEKGILVSGHMRIASVKESRILACWSPEYITGTDFEKWALLRITPPNGILAAPDTAPEVLERFLHIASQRLQGLRLDDKCIHRSLGDNVHSCISGRGDKAWHASLLYFDGPTECGQVQVPTVLCLGPFESLTPSLQAQLSAERRRLPQYIQSLSSMLPEAFRRPSLDLGLPALDRAFSAGRVTRETPEYGPALELPVLIAGQIDYTLDRGEWTYDQWIGADSPLSKAQRAILESDALVRQPVRIVGPAGSGKTLLMQLLAMRCLRNAQAASQPRSVLYVVHNSGMQLNVWDRFVNLGASDFLDAEVEQKLEVLTLSDYSRRVLDDDEIPLLDTDAAESKRAQRQLVMEAMDAVLKERQLDPEKYPLMSQLALNAELRFPMVEMLVSEVAIAIKGHDLVDNRKKYVESDQALSRLHGVLTHEERTLVFDIFREYHQKVFEEMEILDSDDIAITVLARLRTPLWAMKRRKVGYNFVFVDETQLFNENERRLFTLLTASNETHVPVVLALDEAQELRGAVSAGFGMLGIDSIADENLRSVFRCTPSILHLAFHLIQRTTDLFGADFPCFTKDTVSLVPEDHPRAAPPTLYRGGAAGDDIGRFTYRHVEALRKKNLRQVAVVVHAERYWDCICREARRSPKTPVYFLERRGEPIDRNKPLVVITTPEFVGGQEFDAVVAVGLEQGLVPPRVEGHESLRAALEQQALREMYLSFTRARYRLEILIHLSGSPSKLLEEAISCGLLKVNAAGASSPP